MWGPLRLSWGDGADCVPHVMPAQPRDRASCRLWGDGGGGNLFRVAGWGRAMPVSLGDSGVSGYQALWARRYPTCSGWPTWTSVLCVCCHPVLPSPASFCPTRKHILHTHIRAFCKHFPVGSGALRRAEGTRNGSYHMDPSRVGPQCGSPRLQCSGDVLRRSLTWNPPAGLGQPGHQPPESRHCLCGLRAHYLAHDRCACRLGTV